MYEPSRPFLLHMLQKSIRKSTSLLPMDDLGLSALEHVFSCEIEPFKQAQGNSILLLLAYSGMGDDAYSMGGLVGSQIPRMCCCSLVHRAWITATVNNERCNLKLSIAPLRRICPSTLFPNAHRKDDEKGEVDRRSGMIARHSRLLTS
jgi:hypothetical protein